LAICPGSLRAPINRVIYPGVTSGIATESPETLAPGVGRPRWENPRRTIHGEAIGPMKFWGGPDQALGRKAVRRGNPTSSNTPNSAGRLTDRFYLRNLLECGFRGRHPRRCPCDGHDQPSSPEGRRVSARAARPRRSRKPAARWCWVGAKPLEKPGRRFADEIRSDGGHLRHVIPVRIWLTWMPSAAMADKGAR